MEEIFKEHPTIKDYLGGSNGSIKTTNWFGKGITRIITQTTTGRGYKRFKPTKSKSISSHRFIYECFNGIIAEGFEIDHIDGNPSNNTISNLRAVSHRTNLNNPIASLRHSNTTGTKIGVYDNNTGIVTVYPSYHIAEKWIGVSRETLRKVISKGEKSIMPELENKFFFLCDIDFKCDTLGRGQGFSA